MNKFILRTGVYMLDSGNLVYVHLSSSEESVYVEYDIAGKAVRYDDLGDFEYLYGAAEYLGNL